MAITYDELLDKLKQEEETILVEILELRSEDIVNRFDDIISTNLDWLLTQYEEDSGEEETDY